MLLCSFICRENSVPILIKMLDVIYYIDKLKIKFVCA